MQVTLRDVGPISLLPQVLAAAASSRYSVGFPSYLTILTRSVGWMHLLCAYVVITAKARSHRFCGMSLGMPQVVYTDVVLCGSQPRRHAVVEVQHQRTGSTLGPADVWQHYSTLAFCPHTASTHQHDHGAIEGHRVSQAANSMMQLTTEVRVDINVAQELPS